MLPVSAAGGGDGSESSLAGNGMNRLEISASAKSGNIASKSGSFCSRIIHEKLPVGRRTWNSAHRVHQQLHMCGLNTERSDGLAFKPDNQQVQSINEWVQGDTESENNNDVEEDI